MDFDRLVSIINNGELAIVPSDTIYGIIADATNEEAVRKVYEVKQRDFSKPLIVIVSSYEMLKEYVLEINSIEEKIIEKYWPGKVAILLKKNDKIPSIVSSGSDLLALRYPIDKDLIELMNRLNKPLILTSANISGDDVITNVDEIKDELRNNVSYIYDSGIIKGNASTLVKVVDGEIIILRKGDIDIII